MIDWIVASGAGQATGVVLAILAQAIGLYVGYGLLERAAIPVVETVTGA